MRLIWTLLNMNTATQKKDFTDFKYSFHTPKYFSNYLKHFLNDIFQSQYL